MEPGEFDITVSAGASYERVWTLAQAAPDPLDPPIPVDITGCEARMEIRPKAGSTTLFCSVNEISSADGQITIGGSNGQIGVYLSPDATNKLVGRRAAYDIFLEWPGTSPKRVDLVCMGRVTIIQNVTEPSYD